MSVMGDFVLFEDQVDPVALRSSGIEGDSGPQPETGSGSTLGLGQTTTVAGVQVQAAQAQVPGR
jgi:hypothetical protein